MKTRILFAILLAGVIGFTGCKDHINNYDDHYDNTPPNAPANVSVLARDNEVEVYWDKSTSNDVAGYNIYYSYEYNGKYNLIGSTKNDYYVDGGATGPENGVKYYYAVAAYDYSGNLSDLSGTYTFGIPRPEGYDVSLSEYTLFPEKGGYDFSAYSVVNYNDKNNDLFVELYQGKWYLDVWTDSDIKDMGPTQDITYITTAPVSGYVELVQGDNIKYTEAIAGHTYVIRTWDDHFAKVRVKQIAADKIIFDWAYQLIKSERMLKEGGKSSRTLNFDGVKVNRQ